MSAVLIRQSLAEKVASQGFHPLKDSVRPEQVSSAMYDRSFTMEVVHLKRSDSPVDANGAYYYNLRLRIWFLYRLNLNDVPSDVDRAVSDLESLLALLLLPENLPNQAIDMDLVEAVFAPVENGTAGLLVVADFDLLYRVERT